MGESGDPFWTTPTSKVRERPSNREVFDISWGFAVLNDFRQSYIPISVTLGATIEG